LRTIFGILLGLAGGTLLLEAALWILPTENGIFAADADSAWPVHHLIRNSEFTYSAAWNFRDVVHGKINNFGYVAPFDYEPGQRAVIVLGDSYVESMMNPYDETLQAAIGRALDDVATLAFGVAGSALPDYTGLAGVVRPIFDPVWVVIVVTEGDFVDGFDARPGHFTWSEMPTGDSQLVSDVERGVLTKALRRLALVRYTRGNLRLTPRGLFNSRPSTHVDIECVPDPVSPDDLKRIQSYAEALPRAYGLAAQHVILVVDSERQRRALYDATRSNAKVCPRRDTAALVALQTDARSLGINVVDTSPIFERHYRATGVRVDHSPTDWHWNGVGHRLAAKAVLETICGASADAAGCSGNE